jgi:hypothetical protein
MAAKSKRKPLYIETIIQGELDTLWGVYPKPRYSSAVGSSL